MKQFDTNKSYILILLLMHCHLLTVSIYVARYATMSGRRLPPVNHTVPKLPAVNEGGVIMDDIAKGDSGCVAIQQLYEDMRSDWSNYRHRDKSAKNGLDRTIQPVCCSFVYLILFVYFQMCTSPEILRHHLKSHYHTSSRPSNPLCTFLVHLRFGFS